MTLLSEVAIRKRLERGDLVIDPAPRPEHFDSDSVEVHLGDSVYTWKAPAGGAVLSVPFWKRKEEGGFSYRLFAKEHLVRVEPDPDGIVTMRPRTFYLADLRQRTELPNDLAMHVQGKSSLARLGLAVHITAPHAHAGWSGRLTLEMYNFGPFNLELKPDIAIGQLTFWSVEDPPEEVAPKTFSDQDQASGAGPGKS